MSFKTYYFAVYIGLRKYYQVQFIKYIKGGANFDTKNAYGMF